NCFAGICHGRGRYGRRPAREQAVSRGLRSRKMPSSQANLTLTGVKAPHGARPVEALWGDGRTFRLPHRILRGYCPCPGCQGHSGGIRFVNAGDPELRTINQVGNYALELGWGDGHATGIYTYAFLRRLSDLYAAHGDALPEKLPQLPAG